MPTVRGLRFRSFGEDDRAGAFGFRGDGGEDRGSLGRGSLLHQAHVEFDDVGPQQGEQREGRRVRTDVVDGYAPPLMAGVFDGAQQTCGISHEIALGDLDDDRQPQGIGEQRTRSGRRRRVQGRRFGIDEQGQFRGKVHGECASDRGQPAFPVELGRLTASVGCGEHVLRTSQGLPAGRAVSARSPRPGEYRAQRSAGRPTRWQSTSATSRDEA
ncbi:hypothetical protein BJF84_11775 [Rhodococcus sp. CUA-806]|nr:hypothetical protein BJF84_11775 [Rhodococcus sp. CUA-806]